MNANSSFTQDRLIALLHAQYPHRTDILRALQLCPEGKWENNQRIQFIGTSLLEEESGIPIAEKLHLDNDTRGSIIVNVATDGRIARIEFVS